VARDAIARLYDVDANGVKLIPSPEKARYQHGLIHFAAKKGKSINLAKVHESITATRLSGGTNMKVDYLEITARGEVTAGDKLLLKVSGTDQEFALSEGPDAKGVLQRLGQAVKRDGQTITVTGQVQGWSGRFPDVLKALANSVSDKRLRLAVTEFEIAGK
jgi:hypothetical protein